MISALMKVKLRANSEEIVACENQMAELTSAVEAEQTALQSLYQNLASCEAVLAEMKEKRAQRRRTAESSGKRDSGHQKEA